MAKKKVVEEVIETKAIPEKDYYILKVGEALETVAQKFNIELSELKRLNGNDVIGGNQIKLKG